MLTINEALNRLAAWAKSKPEVRCAVLFGSFAKGRPAPRDLDIALVVTFNNLADQIFAMNDWKRELGVLLDFQLIDLNTLAPDHRRVLCYVRDFHLVAFDPSNLLPAL